MSLFRTQSFSRDVVETVASLISQSHFPIPLCHDFEEIDKIYLTYLQGPIGIDKAVYQGKVIRLIPLEIKTDEQKIALLLLISISRAIHHESIVAPIGWVASSNSTEEIILAYDLENSITWKDFCAKATLSWTDRAVAVKNLASAVQLCGVYNAHFRDIHWENVLVEDNLTVKILGQILMNEGTEQALVQSTKHTLYSLGALSLSCVSWGKISSSQEEILIFDPQFLLFQQQFIPLDCPEVLEAIAYACCDIDAPQLPTLPFITQQLTTMIPDIKSWELRLEEQQRAAIQSDAMGAARTAKRFSLLFNTDDFHQHLTQLQPAQHENFMNTGDRMDTPSTAMSEETHSPLHTNKATFPSPQRKFSFNTRDEIVQQRRASHRPVRTSMYIPRTTQSQQAYADRKDDVPSALVKLNEQLLNLEYDLAQSVQELENPFIKEEYESFRPDALRRVMTSIQHCLKRITAHADSLQMATTGESMEPQQILRLPLQQLPKEEKQIHIPSCTEFQVDTEPKSHTATSKNYDFISPPETISPSMPSATARIFAQLSESDHTNEDAEHFDDECDKNGVMATDKTENIVVEPNLSNGIIEAVHNLEANESSFPLESFNVQIQEDETNTTEEQMNRSMTPERSLPPQLELLDNTDNDSKSKEKKSSNKIRKFTALSEKEILHPVITVAVAAGNDISNSSNKSATSAWSLASLTQSQPAIQFSSTLPIGVHGILEMEEIVVSPIVPTEEVISVATEITTSSSETAVESTPLIDNEEEAKKEEGITILLTVTVESTCEHRTFMAEKISNEQVKDGAGYIEEHHYIEDETVPSPQKSSQFGSPRPVSMNAPFPPPPPPPKFSSSQSTSMVATPAHSFPSSRRPSIAVTQTHLDPPLPPSHPSTAPNSKTNSRHPSTQSELINQPSHDNEEGVSMDVAFATTVTARLPLTTTIVPSPLSPPPSPPQPLPETSKRPSLAEFCNLSKPVDIVSLNSPPPLNSLCMGEDDTNVSVKSHSPTPSFHNFSNHPPLLAVVATQYPSQALTMSCFDAVEEPQSDSPSVASVSTASYLSNSKTDAIFQGKPFVSAKPAAISISQQRQIQQHNSQVSPKMLSTETRDASLPPMASPLATASHFLDKIRHLDEMFSTLSGPDRLSSPDDNDKLRSSLPINSLSPSISKSPGHYSPANMSSNYAIYRQSYAHSSSQSPTNNSLYHNTNEELDDNQFDQTADYSPPLSSSVKSKPPLFQPEKQQQLQQTLQMYLSLVQRCSNTSARAKKVLDNLDQHMLSVPTASFSPTQNTSRKNHTYNQYNATVPSPFNPTAAAMQRAHSQQSQAFSGPSYMHPTSSSMSYGGDASPGRTSRNSHQRPNLNRSFSSNSSMSASVVGTQQQTNYLGTQTIPKENTIHAKLQQMSSNTSTSASVAYSTSGVSSMGSRGGSRSGSSQRGGRNPPIRSPVNKEVLSTQAHPRVYSISPSRRR